MGARGASSRHRAREVALQTLYAIDLVAPGPAAARRGAGAETTTPVDPERVFEGVARHLEAPSGAREFARTLIFEVSARRDALDCLIAKRARNWRISRMAAVDRNVLRLGAYELACTDTPAAVVIDEAVELARRFGSDSSPAFVNGILDALARDLRPSQDGSGACSDPGSHACGGVACGEEEREEGEA